MRRARRAGDPAGIPPGPGRFGRALWLLLVLGLLAPGFPWADTAQDDGRKVSPHLNAYYLDADYERWKAVFERPGREIFDQRHRILRESGVRTGMRVADIGAGTGLFTLLFARSVGPAGRVYAVDISPVFVQNILRRVEQERLGNVEGIVNTARAAGLAAGSIDLAFVCDTYHHFEYPAAMLRSIATALRPDGELVVIDFRRIPGVSRPWILGHVRAGRSEVAAEIEQAGFERVASEDFLRENYFLRFRKTR
jgi:SAM-dependent methyltransferase